MRKFSKSTKLDNVCYEIRGPAMKEARRLEEEGYKILKLNIGNTMPFGLHAPDEIVHDIIVNMQDAEGYSDSKGIFPARKAVMHYAQEKKIAGVTTDDIYLGNGVSELIVMSMQAMLNTGDEVLVPTPDYPLWTAAVNLSGGKAVHYLCDEKSGWLPDVADLKSKVTPKTKAIVVINPNNPTGALYPVDLLRQIVAVAQEHGLAVLSDEIYDKVLFDGAHHVSTASLADDILFVTYNGLSKAYRSPGYRAGWMIVSGHRAHAQDYMEGLDVLSSMRLCSNVPGQFAIQTALGGHQSIKDLVAPGGRLREQRDLAYKLINEIPGVSCEKPSGAMYLFPRMDPKVHHIKDDMKFIFDLLRQEKVQVVQGTGFNWPHHDHFRIVFLPSVEDLKIAIARIAKFLSTYRQ